MTYRFKQRLHYLLHARHKGGHGIHSPSLFRLITEVIENKGNYTAYPLLRAAGENVKNILRTMDSESYHQLYETVKGSDAGSVKKLHLLPERFDRLLFRLVNEYRPQSTAFYGSTFGVTLLAMALADRRKMLEAQVENSHYRSFCSRLAEVYEVTNIRLKGRSQVGSADFVVVQHPSDPEYCQSVVMQVLQQPDFSGIVVLCGIHTSAEMQRIWSQHQEAETVRVSLDLFDIGIFICKKGLQKENFVLRF